MRNKALLSLLLLLISLGCKKENEDFRTIIESTIWKTEELNAIFPKLDGENYDIVVLYKATFEINGEFEFIFASLGINSDGTSGGFDTLTGDFTLNNIENILSFKATEPLSSLSDTTIENCDTIKYLIPDWYIKEFNPNRIEVMVEKLDTINNLNCLFILPFDDFNLIPFEN